MPTRKRVEDKQRFGCIYLLTNLIRNKAYVGKSIDFEARMEEHKNGKRYVAMYRKNKKFKSKTFDTVEQCEEWLKTELKL